MLPVIDAIAKDITVHSAFLKILELTSSSNPDQESDTYSDVIYLNIMNEQAVVTPRNTSWNVEVIIINKKASFKVDTGDEVTALSASAWYRI